MKRELSSYFNSPIAYIVTALFLILTGSFFMSVFYLNRNASLRNLFTLFPMILPAFVPALTMRLYAEEKKSGSLETLLTLPVSDFQVAMGKFLFAFIASAIMIAPTLIYRSCNRRICSISSSLCTFLFNRTVCIFYHKKSNCFIFCWSRNMLCSFFD